MTEEERRDCAVELCGWFRDRTISVTDAYHVMTRVIAAILRDRALRYGESPMESIMAMREAADGQA